MFKKHVQMLIYVQKKIKVRIDITFALKIYMLKNIYFILSVILTISMFYPTFKTQYFSLFYSKIILGANI